MFEEKFYRPDGTQVDFNEIVHIVGNYISQRPNDSYEFTVGTDSQNFDKTKMVEVIALHDIGRGGIFFYNIDFIRRINSLRQKITEETQRSIKIADGLVEALELELMEYDIDINELDIRFQIHCDIGQEGKTKTLIKEITNWVRSMGYECLIKPDSYAASGIANKYSK